MENNFSEYFDSSFSPVMVLNGSLETIYFNPMISTLLQLPPRKINGVKVQDLFPLDASLWVDLKTGAEEKGVSVSNEVDFKLNGTDHSFVFRLAKSGDNFYLFGNDLSVEKKLHQKYREQVDLLKIGHQEVLKADKVRAIGELTAGISHEINNPLTVATGNTEILGFILENEDLNSERESLQNCIENIDESLVRISEIILGMKKFLHETGHDKKEYIDLDDVVATAKKLVSSTFEENKIKLSIDIKVSHAVVLGNKTRLEQLLINLLKNSLDSLVEERNKDPHVELIVKKEEKGHYIDIEVIDNGLGVASEIREKIFENFFTTKEMGEGTGLGLSLCRKIAEDHQGSLDYIEREKGACFRLSLPVIEVSSYASNDEILSKINSVDGRKVLVVDNDPTILNLCQKFLDQTPYIFIGSTGGNEALDVLDKYAIDAVITDLQMPGIDGRTFVEKMREQNKNLPVFYLSGSKGLETYQRDKESLNLSGILLKPFKSEELINLLHGIFKPAGKGE